MDATTTGTVTVNSDMSDTWSGLITGAGPAVPFAVSIDQSAGALTGVFAIGGGASGAAIVTGPITGGSIATDTNFVCPCAVTFGILGDAFAPAIFTGIVNAGASAIDGSLEGSGFDGAPVTLTR